MSYTSSEIIDNNVWNHFCITISKTNSNISFYKNGINNTTLTNQDINVLSSVGSLLIGKNHDNTNLLNGNIDDLLIFNKYMDSNEVLNLYDEHKMSISSNNWSHVGSTYNSNDSNVIVFKNGREFGRYTDYSSVPQSNNTKMCIAKSDTNYYDGKLDNVNIFNRELVSTELKSLSDKTNDSSQLLTSRNVLNYKFDTGDNTTIYDSSELQINGTPMNNPTTNNSFTTENYSIELNSSSDQYIQTPSNYDTLDFNQFAVSTWINTNKVGINPIIHNDLFSWYIEGNCSKIKVNDVIYSDATNTYTDSTWTHLACDVNKYDGVVSFYKDGVLNSTSNGYSGFHDDSNVGIMYIGSNDSASFDGYLDNVMIHQGYFNTSFMSNIANSNESEYAPTQIASNIWTHIAATYDSTEKELLIYQNGSNVGKYEKYSVNPGTNSNTDILITKEDNYYFNNGHIDDIRIYHKTMNSNEINDLHNMY